MKGSDSEIPFLFFLQRRKKLHPPGMNRNNAGAVAVYFPDTGGTDKALYAMRKSESGKKSKNI